MPNPSSPIIKTNSLSLPQDFPQVSPCDTYSPSTPQLVPRMIDVHRSIGKTHDKLSHHFLDRTEQEKQELEIWCKKELDHRLAQANSSWIEKAWSSLDLLFNSVTAVISLGVGYFVVKKDGGAVDGSILIAAGVLNLLQTFFNYFRAWDKVCEILTNKNQASKDYLKLVLPFILFFFNTAFSFLSHKGYTRLIDHNVLLTLLEKLQSTLSTANQIGYSLLSLKKGWSEVHLVKIQSELKLHEQNADLLSRLIEFCIQETKEIKSNLKRPINTLLRAAELAAQRA